MNKYTEQFKLTAIKAYLEGSKGLRTVAQRFDIDVSLLRRWVSSYKLHGSISPRKRGQPYSASFKRNVVEYKRTHHLSLRQVAAHFGLGQSSQVGIWEQKYYSGDLESKKKKKRRKSVVMTKKPKPAVPEDKDDALKPREQLMAELEYLRMENAYLKELEALQEQKRRKKQKKP